MTFENGQLDVAGLPQYEASAYHELERAYLKVMYIGTGLFALIPLIPIIIFLTAEGHWDNLKMVSIFLAIWAVLAVFILALVRPRFNQKGYAVRAKDIAYKKGLITRHITTIPFNRVQHCDVAQGPISRYFGLSKLNIYTAGGSNSDVSIPGLSKDTAEKLMDYVLQKTLQSDEEE